MTLSVSCLASFFCLTVFISLSAYFQPLFGPWQTEEVRPPSVSIPGRVPREGRGFFQLWSSRHLPQGTAFLALPSASTAPLKSAEEEDHQAPSLASALASASAYPVRPPVPAATLPHTLTLSKVEKTARLLSLDCAKVITGFQYKSGRKYVLRQSWESLRLAPLPLSVVK